MSRNSYKSRLKIEVIGANLIINDTLDATVEVERTDEEEPNTATVTIYNLSDKTYSMIVNESQGLRVYSSLRDEPYQLVFEGKIKDPLKKKKEPKSRAKNHKLSVQNKRDESDVGTVIVLEETYDEYNKSFFKKTYATDISTKTILNDILKTMGLASSISNNITHKTIFGGRQFNCLSKSAMNWFCDYVGAKWSIQHKVVWVVNKNEEAKGCIVEFNEKNIPEPVLQKDKKIEIVTTFLSFLKPNDWVKISNKRYGLGNAYKISKIRSIISNCGDGCESKITVKR